MMGVYVFSTGTRCLKDLNAQLSSLVHEAS